jgi:hypothetical protein
VFTAVTGASDATITQLTGSGNSLTIAAATTIALGGNEGTVGAIILTGADSNPAKIILANATTSWITTGNTAGHSNGGALQTDTVADNSTPANLRVGIVSLGTSTAYGWIKANLESTTTVAASVISKIGGVISGEVVGPSSSTLSINGNTATAADQT